MKELIKKIPIIGPTLTQLNRLLFNKQKPFSSSEKYWIRRYNSGGNSGAGSYNKLAEFKAEILNNFVKENKVSTVIEYGCGDGNQLKLAFYPSYLGFDISPAAIKLCHDIFQHDKNKSFKLMSEYNHETALLTLSLDVLYHLVEDAIYTSYLERLFDSSQRFVIIYSSDFDEEQKYHERRRQFTPWIKTKKPHWNLIRHLPNRYPYNGKKEESSLSDFYIYEKSEP